MNIAKAISDQNRVRALMALLNHRELCVCQIIEFLGLAPSTVSKHMFILKIAGFIEGRKDGVWIYYRIINSLSPAAKGALKWINSSLSEDEFIKKDLARLEQIIKIDQEKLCKKQKRKK